MSWKVTIRPAADADLIEAKQWYDRQRAGLGDEFLLSIADTMLRLEEFPLAFPV